MSALDGMRVLDFTTGVAGPYATKLLADFGASVLKVEPPEGDPARRDGPFFRNEPHPEGSARFLHLNTNKRSVTLDLDSSDAQRTVRRLAAEYDVVVEDFAPGYLAERGLGYEALDAIRPGVILVSVTPWGQWGPYVGYRQSDIVAQAMGGPMLWTGSAEREPLKLGGALAHYQAGAVAALATMVALYRNELSGEGDHVDVSIYETQIGSRDRVAPFVATHSYNGTEPHRRASGSAFASGIRPTADGYINLMAYGERRTTAFLRMIGRDELVGDERLYRGFGVAPPPELAEDVEASYLDWLMQHGKREAVAEAQAGAMLAGVVNTPEDLLTDPHYRERGVWDTVDHPHTGPLEYPGRPFIMSQTPREPARRAPLLGEHNDEVLTALERADEPAPAAVRAAGSSGAAAGDGGRRLPLEGVRIVDVTVVWAGPYATQLLAEWGAEVIRVEPILRRVGPATRAPERRPTREQQLALADQGIAAGGGYPDFEPGERPWDRNSGFNSHSRNKLSMTADFTTDEGRDLFYRLIEKSDVMIENNVPETIERAGVTYEELRKVNPKLIMLRMPAFGLSGPYKNYRALGTHIEGMIGHHYVRGYPDGTPEEAGDVFTGDAIAGIQGAFAVMLALRHRARSGEGQQIELSQAENFLPILGEQILEWTMNRHDPGPQGNQHRSHAPHQAYPCRGEDEWIAVDIGSDAEFAALCDVIEAPQLASDERFALAASRLANRDELDGILAEATRRYDKVWLFHALQRAGVTAGPLQTAAEKFACPQLQARGFYEYLENDVVGRHWYPGLIWKMARTPNRLRRAPLTLGQDNEYVYKQVMGLSDEEYERHVASGMIGDTYPPSVLGYSPDES